MAYIVCWQSSSRGTGKGLLSGKLFAPPASIDLNSTFVFMQNASAACRTFVVMPLFCSCSVTIGETGSILLEDFHLLDKLAHFDRERIPERVSF
jgi:hypothetical protein